MKLTLETQIIPKNATVIVGVSGGRDSMSLVHALLKQRKDLTIIPAHLNHGLRIDADEDAEFTIGMMTRWELNCELYKPRAAKAGNIEEWGRDKRYEFFTKLAKKHKAAAILTAHHQDDDFESMMLHFLRGTRVKGLSGMQFQREEIVRPLLYTSRNEIDEYVEKHEIPYREDPSNADDRFARNFLRNKIIPVLNHVYPEMAAKWQGQKEYWLELQEMLETSAAVFLQEFLDKKEGLHRAAYKQLPFPIRATVLELWYRESTGERVPDSTTLHRWDEAIITFNSRKKTEWHKKTFLTMSKERAKIQ
ncbi:tRNA lysidine(34) synthetase TilS [Candidatus Peregrinibacteria bacterium]|nr:tRNA lysidine(34) synthetase TilS [Candidatus Peregrinibacteria bacterium]MBT4632024.1 tRNA lysidine(34) synthetase TilS [Candidatus Peregrinibacteria bacterium]MBT5516329.1 tRNA lysidine(34) synthetase TilS [Candidatus Peregrinibacteria bacterium]MBT5824404.1 tRNA lysidine(34) synthetase TilS [Candidatus Peregrinibacteria bacterium]